MTLLQNRAVRCIAILAFFGLLLLPLPIPFRVMILAGAALIWTLLEAGNLKPLGLTRHPLSSTLIWGAGIFLALTAVGEIAQPLIEWLFDTRSDYSGYGALAGNASVALQLLAFALTSAAIGEEILFRGFLLHQLSAIVGPGDTARRVAIVAGAVLFGASHYIQGPFGIVVTGLVGLVFGWAWFRTNRNLWALILAHALIDSYGIGMLYLGRYT